MKEKVGQKDINNYKTSLLQCPKIAIKKLILNSIQNEFFNKKRERETVRGACDDIDNFRN